jgi:transposase
MFNSLPRSVLPFPGRSTKTPPNLPRRRGGQPSNPNALKHGFYAEKHQTPFTGIPRSLTPYQKIQDQFQDVIDQAIPELQEKIVLVMQLSRKNRDFRSLLSLLRIGTILVNTLLRLRIAGYKLVRPARDLQFVAQHAHALIHYDFRSQGITRDADSFLENRVLSDFNYLSSREAQRSIPVDPHDHFLTPRQWALLEPLLPPLDHIGPRGRPPADPREMLDAIFWKFAHHARWQDLPPGYPPMLTCRRYYRRLFLSGRLATLYSALYKDLRSRGMMDLTAFVSQDCFEISGHGLTFRPKLDETWQLRTALLFLQQGYQVFRCHFGRIGRNGYEI